MGGGGGGSFEPLKPHLVANKLVDEVFCHFSPPEQLHSDQGRQFKLELIQELCKCSRHARAARHLITHNAME